MRLVRPCSHFQHFSTSIFNLLDQGLGISKWLKTQVALVIVSVANSTGELKAWETFQEGLWILLVYPAPSVARQKETVKISEESHCIGMLCIFSFEVCGFALWGAGTLLKVVKIPDLDTSSRVTNSYGMISSSCCIQYGCVVFIVSCLESLMTSYDWLMAKHQLQYP